MENTSQNVQSLEKLATLLVQKLSAEQTSLTIEFENMAVHGPGPQGTQGQWRLNGKVSLTAKSNNKG